jgi:hypothetical protein
MKFTLGPWKRKSIPGHVFELHNEAGDIVLRIRGGMMPTLEDSRLLEAAPELLDLVRTFYSYIGTMKASGLIAGEPWMEKIRPLLSRIEGDTR